MIMIDIIEEQYIESDYEEIFNDWYEIEGVRKIKELSRQLRTFFNYKTEVIRYRFRSSANPAEGFTINKFLYRKQKIESLSEEFINILKMIKKEKQTIEQGISSLLFETNKKRFRELKEVTENLSILIHYFSEEDIYNYPRFLKFILVLAKNTCLVKMCLYTQFREFYRELEMSYHNLEGELEFLLEKTRNVNIRNPKKQLEERLTS